MMNYKVGISIGLLKVKFLGVFILILCNPIFIWPVLKIIGPLFALFFLGLIFIRGRVSAKKLLLALFIFQILILYKYLQGASYFGVLYFSFVVALIVLVRNDTLIESFLVFKYILSIVVGFGIFVWLIHLLAGNSYHLFMGYLPDEYVLNQLKVETGARYGLYPLSTRIVYDSLAGFYRFQSVFDEPGYLGTVSALVIAASRGSLKEWTNKVIFLGGVLSLSLAFYILMFLYYILFFLKEPVKFIKVSVFVFLLAFSISFSPLGQFIIENYLVDRIAFEDGDLAGNNRSNDYLNDSFDYFFSEASFQEMLFGLPHFEGKGSSSIKQIPVTVGFAGVSIIILMYLMLAGSYLSRPSFYSAIFILIYFISAFQRPSIADPVYLFIFIAGLLYSETRKLPRRNDFSGGIGSDGSLV